jgi:hypothetical protein
MRQHRCYRHDCSGDLRSKGDEFEMSFRIKVRQKSSNVIPFRGETTVDMQPFLVLAGAHEANLQHLFVLGISPAGKEYFAGTSSDPGLAITLVERFKYMIMQMGDAA